MTGFLDYEIWKASYMLSQNIPQQEEITDGVKEWEEFDRSGIGQENEDKNSSKRDKCETDEINRN